MGHNAIALVNGVRMHLNSLREGDTGYGLAQTGLYSLCNLVIAENPNPAIMQDDLYQALLDVEHLCGDTTPSPADPRADIRGLCVAARKKWDHEAEANAWRPQITEDLALADDTPREPDPVAIPEAEQYMPEGAVVAPYPCWEQYFCSLVNVGLEVEGEAYRQLLRMAKLADIEIGRR